jgi:hypothetical protein
MRPPNRGEPALPELPEPTSAAPAERGKPIRKEHLDAGPRHRMDVKKGLMPIAGRYHAATSVGSARANPRR